MKSNNNNKLEIKNEDIIPKSAFASNKSRKELNKIKEIEKNVDREKLIYKTNKHTYDFRKFNTIRTFGEDIYDGKITLEEANESHQVYWVKLKNLMIKQDRKHSSIDK